MWIKSLELNNWQKHSDLKIDLTEGVNVIYGHSDSGKSCVRRAIEWVCQNSKIDGIRKSNTKLTSVRLTLHNDIVIERIRSASINRYVIHENKKEDRVFDSIGKTIPDEVKEILKIEPITIDDENIYLNSAPQLALPFLFDKSPTFRMKIFNKLTGNDILDKLFVQFNKDILSIKKETKRESGHLEEQIKTLADLKIKKEKLESVHEKTKKSLQNITKLHERYSKLLELNDSLDKTNNEILLYEEKLKSIKIPDLSEIKELKEKSERLCLLKDIENEAEKTETSLEKVRGQFKEINVPELDYDVLKGKIERFETLSHIAESLDKNEEICYILHEKLEKIEYHIDAKIMDYKELLKKVKICPICGSNITEKHLKEIKL